MLGDKTRLIHGECDRRPSQPVWTCQEDMELGSRQKIELRR